MAQIFRITRTPRLSEIYRTQHANPRLIATPHFLDLDLHYRHFTLQLFYTISLNFAILFCRSHRPGTALFSPAYPLLAYETQVSD